MGSLEVTLEGRGLHHGEQCVVRLRRRSGPFALATPAGEVPWFQWRTLRTDHGVTISAGQKQVDLVEHLLAAIGAGGFYQGLCLHVQGPELPLLDGGSLQWSEALSRLGIPQGRGFWQIAEPFEVTLGHSHYRFEPAENLCLQAEVEFGHPSIGKQAAQWQGGWRDFAQRIAPARTFGFMQDVEALRAAGRAQWVDPAKVVVFASAGPLGACGHVPKDEPARHKLLDMIGDVAFFGSLASGCLTAKRPGHGATHHALARAIEAGALRWVGPSFSTWPGGLRFQPDLGAEAS